MQEALKARRKHTQDKLTELRSQLSHADEIVRGSGCVYVTGSFGRGEASKHSDLDLFIVGDTDGEMPGKRLLTNLNEICLKADLIRTVRQLGFPEFSGDGEYLEHYTVEQLVKALGTPADDATNTFTARLLLLLESRPLIGKDVYDRAVDAVIDAYWRDYATHKGEFIPAFLANDILRLWRTFCVNYEARTQSEPGERRQKRRVKNYKLKHSRLLTCYSALLYLMAVFAEKHTVAPDDARKMVVLTPTERMEYLQTLPSMAAAGDSLAKVLDSYALFLDRSNAAEAYLLAQVADDEQRREMFQEADDFGAAMYEALNAIGRGSRFHRMLVV